MNRFLLLVFLIYQQEEYHQVIYIMNGLIVRRCLLIDLQNMHQAIQIT